TYNYENNTYNAVEYTRQGSQGHITKTVTKTGVPIGGGSPVETVTREMQTELITYCKGYEWVSEGITYNRLGQTFYMQKQNFTSDGIGITKITAFSNTQSPVA